MYAFLVGRCGKSTREALRTTMPEYVALMRGKEEEQRILWEVARWEQFMQLQMSGDIKTACKPHTITSFIRFPWDKEQEEAKVVYKVTEAEFERLKKIFR